MTDAVALSISQFIDAWRIFGRAQAGSKMESAGGVDYIFTGLPIAFFNVAVPTGGPLSSAALDTTARGAGHVMGDMERAVFGLAGNPVRVIVDREPARGGGT